MWNAARIGHKLTEIRDDSTRFARFSLTIVIKKSHTCFRDISSKMTVPRKAAVELILQLELEENNFVKVERLDPDSLTWKNMAVRHWQNHQPGATD